MNKRQEKALRYVVGLGDMLFVLWMLYNGMDEGWKVSLVQLFSNLLLIILLILSSILIFPSKRKS